LGGQGKQGRVETRDSRRVTTGDADRESPQPSSSTTNSVIPEAVEDITRASGTGGAFSRPGPAHERNSDTTRRRRRATVRTAGRDREAHDDTHERERRRERERTREDEREREREREREDERDGDYNHNSGWHAVNGGRASDTHRARVCGSRRGRSAAPATEIDTAVGPRGCSPAPRGSPATPTTSC
jgi:hypothetical protein